MVCDSFSVYVWYRAWCEISYLSNPLHNILFYYSSHIDRDSLKEQFYCLTLRIVEER